MRFRTLATGTLLAVLASLSACSEKNSAALSSAEIDRVVERTIEQFSVPGIAVGVIKDGNVVHSRGYGVREIGKPGSVAAATLFKIASNSKAMTTAALAILVDEGKLSWNDKVADHLPDFKLHDEWVTAEFTVADLLTHRSGLGLGAGDLMLWPEPNSFSRKDIIRGLRHFRPASSFRTQYAYDNLLYIVAGELIPAVSDHSWESFVDERVLGAIGAERCFAGDIPSEQMVDIAAPHGVLGGELQVIERSRIEANTIVSAAAGGVRCSLQDMLVWVDTQLNLGTTAAGEVIFSAEQSAAMWRSRTLRSVSEDDLSRDRTHFKAYGLGWRLADVHGYREVSHTGTLAGMSSYVVLIPELDLGVVVLTNGSSSAARRAIMYSIVRSYMGVERRDWIDYLVTQTDPAPSANEAGDAAAVAATATPARPLTDYTGDFDDPWFGRVSIRVENGALQLASQKSPRMAAELLPFSDDVFVARWLDRTLEADAFVRFAADSTGSIDRLALEAISDRTDFSFNYGDLNLIRTQGD